MAGAVIDESVGPARDGEPRANPRFALFLLILFTCYNTLDSADRTVLSGSFQSVGAFLRDDLHTTATDAAFGSLTSAFIVGFSISAVVVGQVAGRWPHLNLVIVAALGVLWTISVLVCATASSFGALLAGRAMSGLGEAAWLTVVPPVLQDLAPPGRKGTWISLYFMSVPVGVSVGYVLGGYLGWRAAFGVELAVAAPLTLTLCGVAWVQWRATHGASETDRRRLLAADHAPATPAATSAAVAAAAASPRRGGPSPVDDGGADDPYGELTVAAAAAAAGGTSGDAPAHDGAAAAATPADAAIVARTDSSRGRREALGPSLGPSAEGFDVRVAPATPRGKAAAVPVVASLPALPASPKAAAGSLAAAAFAAAAIVLRPHYLCLVLGGAGWQAVNSVFAAFTPQFIRDLDLVQDQRAASTALSVVLFCGGTAGTFLGGVALDRLRRRGALFCAPKPGAEREAAAVRPHWVPLLPLLRPWLAWSAPPTADLPLILDFMSPAIGLSLTLLLLVPAAAVLGLGPYLVALSLGAVVSTSTIAPYQAAVMAAVAPAERPLALGLGQLIIHVLGDVPFPPLIGWTLDALAPAVCSGSGGGGHAVNGTSVASSEGGGGGAAEECARASSGVRWVIFLAHGWQFWPTLLWAMSMYFARHRLAMAARAAAAAAAAALAPASPCDGGESGIELVEAVVSTDPLRVVHPAESADAHPVPRAALSPTRFELGYA